MNIGFSNVEICNVIHSFSYTMHMLLLGTERVRKVYRMENELT